MRFKHLVHVIGIMLVALSPALVVAGVVSSGHREPAAFAFFVCALIVFIIGFVSFRRTRLERDLTIREGYAVVALTWITVGVVGAIPYLFTGVIRSPMGALFESISGFTTTGATVLTDIESLPAGILIWRSMTQWLGGMGIVLLGVAILPFLGVGGMQLFHAEELGPKTERLKPRIRQTASTLWYVYAGLTAAQVVLYSVGGMGLFDAINHAFTTLSTGGFSTRDASLAAYNSPYLHYVTIAFMYLAAVNFTLHYRLLRRRCVYHTDPEWRFFTSVLLTATAAALLIALMIPGASELERSFEPVFRETLFQVISIGTTTGFVNADYGAWAPAGQLVLVFLMFMGGMAGSTAGGMKAMRIRLLFRHGLTELKRSVHPRAVIVARLGKTPVDERTVLRVLAFALFFIALFGIGAFGLTLLGHDLVTATGASAASLGNIGPGLGGVGPMNTYTWMGGPSHAILIVLMLAGRLELFTILLLFHPDLWRRHTAKPIIPRA